MNEIKVEGMKAPGCHWQVMGNSHERRMVAGAFVPFGARDVHTCRLRRFVTSVIDKVLKTISATWLARAGTGVAGCSTASILLGVSYGFRALHMF